MASHKILVIDDSRVIRNMVRDMLPKGNFQVLEAKDGVEGMNSIKQERPNLIMLDFLLPRMSGWEVFQQIQEQPELQKIPLVVMSGRREEVAEKISEPFEFFEFIEKPFEQKELIDAIKAAMSKAKLPRPQVATASASVATEAAGGANAGEVAALKQKMAEMQAEIDLLKKQEELVALKQKMAKMQGEIDLLKKQTAQILNFIKQKLR